MDLWIVSGERMPSDQKRLIHLDRVDKSCFDGIYRNNSTFSFLVSKLDFTILK